MPANIFDPLWDGDGVPDEVRRVIYALRSLADGKLDAAGWREQFAAFAKRVIEGEVQANLDDDDMLRLQRAATALGANLFMYDRKPAVVRLLTCFLIWLHAAPTLQKPVQEQDCNEHGTVLAVGTLLADKRLADTIIAWRVAVRHSGHA